MRPFYETIAPDPGSSWSFLDRRLPSGIPFEWHHHPQYELTLTLNSRGYRYIGNNVDRYYDGDLVLISPGINHSWCSEGAIEEEFPHIALVCWFDLAWIESAVLIFPEFNPVLNFLTKASQGIKFSEAACDHVRPLMEEMRACDVTGRLTRLLMILDILRKDHASQIICLSRDNKCKNSTEDTRILRVINYIHENYTEIIRAETLSKIACVSLSTFHRMFRRHTRMTMVEYLVRLRIGHACSLLIGTTKPISIIATDVGYTNLSLFNRQFLRLRNELPSHFRKQHTQLRP